jgi:hypothetical protein
VRIPRGVALRWLPPVVATAVVSAAVTLPAAFSSPPPPVLAAKSVDAVVADLLLEQDKSVSGTTRATADLGLPDLPVASLGGLGVVVTLLTGTHTLQYWQAGAQSQRLAILDTLAETDLVRVGSSFGTYDSREDAATRLSIPRVNGGSAAGQSFSQLLTGLVAPGDNTDVRPGPAVRIAGRSAYSLDLVPRQAGTLVDHVEIAVDADRGTALRIRVYAKGYRGPAFEATYTSISFTTPPARLFDLISRLPTAAPTAAPAAARPAALIRPEDRGIETAGSGWATIVRLPLGQLGTSLARSLDRLTEAVPAGRLLRTHLITALLTPDGSLWVGAVPAAALIKAAGG